MSDGQTAREDTDDGEYGGEEEEVVCEDWSEVESLIAGRVATAATVRDVRPPPERVFPVRALPLRVPA